jgi:hypothetical protein
MEQVKTKSVEPQQRYALPEVSWDELNEAGLTSNEEAEISTASRRKR